MDFQLPFPTSTTPRGGEYGSKVLDNGKPRANWHRGHDFAPGAGKAIPAIADGEVVAEGYSSAVGYWIEIKHGSVYATYCHMKGASPLHVGSDIKRGVTVGHVGATGAVTGAHLHLVMSTKKGGGLSWSGILNPVVYIKARPVGSTPVVKPKPPVTTPASSTSSYTVRAGDSLSKIAAKFKTTWQALYALNKARIGANPNVLKIGTKLAVRKAAATPKPKPTVRRYTVKRGDSLSSIAAKYGTTWQKLYAKNKKAIGKNPNVINAGTVLVIP